MRASDSEVARYSLPVIPPVSETDAVISEVAVARIGQLIDNDATRWYAQRKLFALQAAGLVGATKWDPKLHPRGRDGKFIITFGWVRYLVKGKWERAQVKKIDADGNVHVRPSGSIVDKQMKPNELFALPKPKATLAFPEAGKGDSKWAKIGGQAGSNPGGLFAVTDAEKVAEGARKRFDTQDEVDQIFAGWSKSLHPDAIPDWDKPTGFAVVVPSDEVSGGFDIYARRGNTDDAGTDPIRLENVITGESVSPSVVLSDDESAVVYYTHDASLAMQLDAAVSVTQAVTPDVGEKFYIKTNTSKDRAANELLANRFYEALGVPVPETYIDASNPKIFGSKILEGEALGSASLADPAAVFTRLQDDMAIDAWLGNWDVIGLGLDNVKVDENGVPYRIDAGGALLYRAMGSPKGSMFGAKVTEIDTFRSGKNPAAKKIFGGTTDQQIKSGVERIAALSPEDITRLVDESGLPDSLAETLIARRTDLMTRYSVDDPYLSVPEAVTSAEAPAVPSVSRTYDPSLGKWVPGSVGNPAANWAGSQSWLELFDVAVLSDAEVLKAGDTISLGETEPDGTVIYPFLYEVLEMMPVGGSHISAKLMNHYTGKTEWNMFNLNNPQPFKRVIGDPGETNIENYEFISANSYADVVNKAISDYQNVGQLVTPTITEAYDVYGADEWDFSTTPPTLNAVALPLLGGQDHEDGWIVWHKTYDTGGTVTSGMALIEKDSDGNAMVVIAQQINDDGTGKTIDAAGLSEEALMAAVGTPIGSSGMKTRWAKLTPNTDEIANGMVTREAIITHDEDWPTATPVKPEMAKVVHAEVPVTTVTDGTEPDGLPDPEPVKKPTGALASSMVTVGGEKSSMKDILAEMGVGEVRWVLAENYGEKYPVKILKKSEDAGGSNYITSSLAELTRLDGSKISGGYFNEVRPLEMLEPPEAIVAARVPEVTFKKDGSLVNKRTGAVIGSWSTYNSYYTEYTVKIDAAFTLDGNSITYKANKRYDTMRYVKNNAYDLSPDVAVSSKPIKKTAETQHVEAVIKGEAVVTTINGVEMKTGLTAQSLKSGALGKITVYEPGTSWAILEAEDPKTGKTKDVIVDIKYLKAVGPDLPSTALKLDNDPTPLPKPSKAVPIPGTIPMQLDDGSDIYLGQVITAGKTDKNKVTGTVTKFGVDDIGGIYLMLQSADGKKYRRTTKGATLVEDIPENDKKHAELPAAVAIASSAITSPKPAKPSAVEVTISEAEPGVPGTEMPASSIIELTSEAVPQSLAAKEAWLSGSAKRQLMHGGLAPQVGMEVYEGKTDSKGNWVITSETPMVIMGMPGAGDASVRLWDPVAYKIVNRQAQKLSINVDAYFGTEGLISNEVHFVKDGVPESFKFPAGSMLYKRENMHSSNRLQGNSYVVVFPDGRMAQLPGTSPWKKEKPEDLQYFLNSYEKLGVLEEGVDKKFAMQPYAYSYSYTKGSNNETAQIVTIYTDDDTVDAQTAIKLEWEKSQIQSITPLEPDAPIDALPTVDAKLSTSFGKPDDAPESEQVQQGASPQVTGSVDIAALKQKPTSLATNDSVNSVDDAITKLLANRGKEVVHGGTFYASADGDYVEDMAVRFQVVRDSDGNEFVEARFKLLEDKSEDVANGLLTLHDAKFGDWSKTDTVTPTGLLVGDYISVRKSAANGTLKPSSGADAPNAKIKTTPTLIGTSDKNGFSIYRAEVDLADGSSSIMDFELRDAPSINRFVWDANKPVHTSKSSGQISSVASSDGWSTITGQYVPTLKTAVDATGVSNLPDGYGSGYKVHEEGNTLWKTMPDGTVVRLVTAHAGISGTGHKSARRTNMNGEARVRVPLPKGGTTDQDAILTSLSRGMEAVGLPAEKQVAPDDTNLLALALNKLHKTHGAQFKHREQITKAGQTTQADVEKILKDTSSQIGLTADPLTLKDLELMVADDGRVTVRLSRRGAEAITKQQGNKYYKHSIAGNHREIITQMLGGTTVTGILAAEERWSMGIMTHGQSSSSDMRAGAGNGIYITGKSGALSKSSGHWAEVIFSPIVVNRSLEIYTNEDDGWGHRKTNNSFAKSHANYEYMPKARFDPEQFAYVRAGSDSDRNAIIADLKKRGVTHIKGRPIEDIVVTTIPVGTEQPADFNNLGDVSETVITGDALASAIAGGTAAAPAPAGVPA